MPDSSKPQKSAGRQIAVKRNDFRFWVCLAQSDGEVYLLFVKVQEIQNFVERQPFRPFAIRLNNGANYSFKTPRDVGAPKHYQFIIYFGDSEAVRIDTDGITEIIER